MRPAHSEIASASRWIASAASWRSLGTMSPPFPAMRVTSSACWSCAAVRLRRCWTIRSTIGRSSTRAALASSGVKVRGIRPYDHPAVRPGQRQALDVYLWSRAAIWIAAIFAFFFFEPNRHPNANRWDTPRLHDMGYFTDIWARWDSDFFLRIAQNGYDGASAAFHPLYPALIAVLGRAFFGHYVLAGLVVSLLSSLGSFTLLYRLAEQRLGAVGARRSVLYLALFPMALFLQAVYSEFLFLLLVLAGFALAERNRLAGAGVTTGLAILARVAGVALLPALALLAWRSRERGRAFAGLALVVPV